MGTWGKSDISRRLFLKRTLQAAIAGGVLYPTLIEPFRVVVEKITIPLDRLPPVFEGFRIVQLSDLHYRPYTTLGQIAHVVERVNASQPDLIVITGDFITHGSNHIEELAPTLAKLQARHGVSGVLGNHDCESGAGRVTAALRKVGLEILRNEGRELTRDGSSICLAGVDSACNAHPDLSAALVRCPPGKPTILLAHEPDFADLVPADAGVSLQLSGHSHGGQVCLPLVGALILPDLGRKYWHGLRKVNNSLLYTNRGIGTIGLPIRVGSLPEITEFTLVGTASAHATVTT